MDRVVRERMQTIRDISVATPKMCQYTTYFSRKKILRMESIVTIGTADPCRVTLALSLSARRPVSQSAPQVHVPMLMVHVSLKRRKVEYRPINAMATMHVSIVGFLETPYRITTKKMVVLPTEWNILCRWKEDLLHAQANTYMKGRFLNKNILSSAMVRAI